MSSDPTSPDQQDLQILYLQNLRRRFKFEINRLTGGGMAELLHDYPQKADLSFLLTYLYAYYWLRQHVPEVWRAPLLAAFKGSSRAFLMDMLEHSGTGEQFVADYIQYWHTSPGPGPAQREQLFRLLGLHNGDAAALSREILKIWKELHLFSQSNALSFARIAKEERHRYGEMLGDSDKQRLALLDRLPDVALDKLRFDKLGLIPHMGCPQTCRHCMFVWRPFVRGEDNASRLYELVDRYTDSVLFTGGDLTRHMQHFYRGIAQMQHIRTFAILLNGDFADTRQQTREMLGAMQKALDSRPSGWVKARILLQISFDEFHQEVYVDKHGELKERIPVSKIANIVEAVPRYQGIQLALLHKQNHLNFSMDFFNNGVFGRLAQELGKRGHQLQVLSTAPSERHKTRPGSNRKGQLIKDASFVLSKFPSTPILLTSSTIDAYGRAELLEESETVRETEFLAQVLAAERSPGQGFDTDLMFWFNGWATLFSAVHICLGNVVEEGAERVLQRQRKDPLIQALADFDRRLLTYYAEQQDDLQQLIATASGPHHLFHKITEKADMRLHMTRRLIA